jgi:ATP-dependent Clp protease ATP-binding subunit ClpC
VEDPLSDALLSGEFENGDTIVVDVIEDEVKLRRSEEQSAPPSPPEEAVEAA